jgi:hypothetical protein
LVIFFSVGLLTGLSDWRHWRAIGMASDCGRNAQQIVSYRDIYFLTLIFRDFSACLANLVAGLRADVRVLFIAASARRRWSAALV